MQSISSLGVGAFTLPHPANDASAQKQNVELPIWAPNGKKLMVIAGKTLFTTNPDGTGSAKISDYGRGVPAAEDFAWSPDSQRLAYGIYGSISVAEADGSRKIQVADSNLRRVKNSLVGWSSDSKQLLFVEQSAQDEFYLYSLPIPETLPDSTQELDQSNRKRLATWSIQEFRGCRMHPIGH
ncbi:MAG: hypothetical protein LH660_08355 [Phormidesmis sp. CAN_BIN36]|nr:hypothetical protein [Phormidesmis sp. CAN_BIN36]